MKGRIRTRVLAPLAATLMVSFAVATPAQAANGDNGKGAEQSQVAAERGSSEEAKARQAERTTSKPSSTPAEPKGEAKAEPKRAEDHASKGTASTRGHNEQGTVEGTRQPLSKADQNEAGANGQCPGGTYCATPRTDEPAPNGKGDGKVTGKPCAGCVGKADNKNPQGQMPDPKTDGNRGYECDDNQGIGVGNPAHTGCEPSGTVTDVEPDTGTDTCPDPMTDYNGDAAGCGTPPAGQPGNDCPGNMTDYNGEGAGCGEAPTDGEPTPGDEPVVGGQPGNDCPTGMTDYNGRGAGCGEAPTPQAEVLGEQDENNPETTAFTEDWAQPGGGTPAAEVAGVQRTAPTILPQTGAAAGLTLLLIAGLGMATAGALTLLFRRRFGFGR